MTIEIPDLSSLTQAQVDQGFAYAVQLLAEKRPNIDTRRGVIGDLMLDADAIFDAARRENWDRLRLSMSLLAITEDPALAEEDTVDQVLSNWGITRRSASNASGEMTIVLNALVAFTVAAGEVFTADGVRFITETAFAARTDPANVISATDRALTQIADDQWAFTITVVAEEPGSDGLIRKDTAMVPSSTSSAFVKAFAANDFTGGADAQTNAELLLEQQEGIATKAYSNRPSTVAAIKAQEGFETIEAISVVGFGDPEMVRDQHWLFPMSGGGRTDLYLRSQFLPQSITKTVTATLIDKTGDGGIWQFSLLRDDAPGFYEVTQVRLTSSPPDDSGYEITEDIRGVDLTQPNEEYVPDIQTTLEAVYSKYQAATIRFLDTDTDVSSLTENNATQDYEIAVSVMPLVRQVQEFIGDRDAVNPNGDHLVKAAVPCFLTLNFELQRQRTTATVDEDGIKSALTAYVNDLDFPGKIYAGALSRLVDERLPDKIDVSAIDMFGRIRRPDGVDRYIRADDILTVPDEPEAFTTGRTVCFFLETAAIGISIVDVEVPAV